MDASEWAKRNGLGKNRQDQTTGESSGWSEREVERLNERGRKPMKNNCHRWGGGRASIAGEPLRPGEAPMSTLCTGFEWRGMRLRGNERFRGPNGDQHGLRSQELDEGPSDLTAWPIAPAHRLSRNRRGGWCLFSRRRRLVRLGGQRSTSWRRRGARPEDGAHPARLLRGTGFLTLFAQWARATMATAGRI